MAASPWHHTQGRSWETITACYPQHLRCEAHLVLHEDVKDDRLAAKIVRNLGEKLTHRPRAEAVKMCHSALKRESGGGIESVMHVNASFEDAALH